MLPELRRLAAARLRLLLHYFCAAPRRAPISFCHSHALRCLSGQPTCRAMHALRRACGHGRRQHVGRWRGWQQHKGLSVVGGAAARPAGPLGRRAATGGNSGLIAAAAAAAAGCCAGWHAADGTGWTRCDAPVAVYDERGRPSHELTREVQQWIARRRSTGDNHGADGWVTQVEKAAAKSLRGKRVLVFVNPECGPKQAKQHSEDIVRPMLAALGCLSVEICETDTKHSAMELLRTADVSELDAVRRTLPLSPIRDASTLIQSAPALAAPSGLGVGWQRHSERSRAGALLRLAGTYGAGCHGLVWGLAS